MQYTSRFTAWGRSRMARLGRASTLLLLAVGCCQSVSVLAADQPNVLLILTDDQGYGDMGCHGNVMLQTPHLDRLAEESVEMTHFFVCPNCSPTRASLLTGRYNYRTGVTAVYQGCHLMRTDEVTLAEWLKSAGYRTGIFGKWHLGSQPPMRPTDQGFDEALVHKGGGIGQEAGPPGNKYFDPVLEHNNHSQRFTGYCDDIFADATIEFIEQNRDRPFFAYWATNLPHFPLEVSDKRADPYRKLGLHEHNALTYGMITNIDANVGRVLDKVSALGLADNTIVIFLSDNGPRTRRTKNDRYPGRYVAGLRGTKTSVYENGIRVPFLIRWPGVLLGGRKVSTMAGHVDLVPTILDACGIARRADIKLDGLSLMPLLRGEREKWPDRALVFQWHAGPVPFEYVHFAVRTQRYKLVQPQDDPHSFAHHPTRDELREILNTLELYDVAADPSEINNIAASNPATVEALLARYEDWFSEVTAERDYHAPQPIHLGTDESPVVLTRFEWTGPRVDTNTGSWDEQQGHWRCRVMREGDYEITLHFAKTSNSGSAVVRFGDRVEAKPVEEGQTACRFRVRLDARVGRLEAFLKLERLRTGVHFVDVRLE